MQLVFNQSRNISLLWLVTSTIRVHESMFKGTILDERLLKPPQKYKLRHRVQCPTFFLLEGVGGVGNYIGEPSLHEGKAATKRALGSLCLKM